MRVPLLLAILLAGCGQSGDLYLPTEPAPGAPAAASAPTEETDEQKKEPR